MSDGLLDLTTRVDKLERQNRWLRWAVIAIVILAGAVVLMGQAKAKPEEIKVKSVEAQAFLLRDESGKPGALLTFTKQGPGLALYDDSVEIRAIFHVMDGQPRLNFQDSKGNERLRLGVVGEPLIQILNSRGKVNWEAP